MKNFFESALCLLVGLAIGVYVGYHYYERHIINETTRQMLAGMESSAREHAAEATRLIELIGSGDNTNAVRLLATPIGDYYQWYALHADTPGERQLRAMIEQLARTNQVVADAIRGQTR